MTLFPEIDPPVPPAGPEAVPDYPRLLEANRTQVVLRATDLEGLLPAGRPAAGAASGGGSPAYPGGKRHRWDNPRAVRGAG